MLEIKDVERDEAGEIRRITTVGGRAAVADFLSHCQFSHDVSLIPATEEQRAFLQKAMAEGLRVVVTSTTFSPK